MKFCFYGNNFIIKFISLLYGYAGDHFFKVRSTEYRLYSAFFFPWLLFAVEGSRWSYFVRGLESGERLDTFSRRGLQIQGLGHF